MKPTNERLKTIASWRAKYSAGHNIVIPAEEAEAIALELMANREALATEGTQFKPVADLFALGWDNGEVCSFVTDPDKAFYWLTGYTGTCVQEYVKLERMQAAYTAPPAVTDELLEAMDEVIRISDRDHEAWDRAKNAISACRVAKPAQPVGYLVPGFNRDFEWGSANLFPQSGGGAVIPVYLAAPAVPEGYCIMPLTLTAANGAKGALSGEFKVSRTVTCNECGGEGCMDCNDRGEFEEEITVPWSTIKEIYRAAVDACHAAPLAAAPTLGKKQ